MNFCFLFPVYEIKKPGPGETGKGGINFIRNVSVIFF